MLEPALLHRLDAFLAYLRYEKNLSPKTQENYRRQILAIAEQLNIDDWSSLTQDHVKSVLALARRQQLSASSIALRLSALRSFCQYLLAQGVLTHNPTKHISAPKQGKALPKHLNVDELAHLLDIDAESPLAVRDRAMMELTYGCGLRLAELCSLNISDVQSTETVRVVGKGQKERQIPMGTLARQWVSNWLKVRQQLCPPSDETALFVSMHKRRISHRQIAKRMQLWANKKSLGQSIHPHKLRHSYATHMLESSGDLRAVQELLGHANLSTTQVYTHLDFQHLAKVYDSAHPRARKKT